MLSARSIPLHSSLLFLGSLILGCASGENQESPAPGSMGGSVGQSGGSTSAPGSGGHTTANGGSVSEARGGGATTLGGSNSSAGGASALGGSSSGGATSSGTSGGAVNGGSSSTGAGGASASCTDTPPANGDTCAHAVEYKWCGQSWLNGACARSCGQCTGTGSGAGGSSSSNGGASSSRGGSTSTSGGSSQGFGGGSVADPPRITNGSNGFATRYWDCCKPACGWKGNVPSGSTPVQSCNAQGQSMGANYDAKNACEGGGSAYMCQDFSPWPVSPTLAYGFAAVSKQDYCGRCFQLQFTGQSHNSNNDAGSQSLANKTMIVQAINNGGVGGDQFDLLIPGGGVGDFDACSSSWGTTDLGERYGGFFLACQKQNNFNYDAAKACTIKKCQTVFANKPDLLEGCDFFVDWFGAPDNPALVYKEVTCPDAITAKSGLKR